MSEPAPVAEGRRIKSLDVVRGLALLGILAVNAAYFAAPMQAAQNPSLAPIAIDDGSAWSWFVMHVFFEFKMITLFSMLFGASIYMIGGERSDKERGAVLRRRLGWLVLIGALHGALIWYGDILLTYALTGLLVMLARSWRERTLMIVGVILFLLSVAVMWGLGAMLSMAPTEALEEVRAEMWAPSAEEIARIVAAYQGGLVTATSENFRLWTEFLTFIPIMMLRTAGVMMIGMALFKWGFFSGNARIGIYLAVAAIGALALAAVARQAQLNAELNFDFVHMMSVGMNLNGLLSPFISLLYASVLILLVKAGALKFLTDALAAVGRMAFTNYLMQSIIMTTIFYGGRGLGLYGEFDRVSLWGVVVAIWVLQLIWSPLWLSKYQMGPFEWAWRRLSYGRPLAIAKA
ncbi:MAG TPA: DUF418 domain-containing protein [Terricaulis sp.]|nr:DUF418 domain-containing protein [Terricaulis sp.]